jgi:hypothetical protein
MLSAATATAQEIDIDTDLNDDGTTNILDLTLAVNAFMDAIFGGMYDESIDVNGDGKVNVLDLVQWYNAWRDEVFA